MILTMENLPEEGYRTLRDWYQNVPQGVKFDIFRHFQENNIGKIRVLGDFYPTVWWQKSISEMGVGMLDFLQSAQVRYHLKIDIYLVLMVYYAKEYISTGWAISNNMQMFGRIPSENLKKF